MKNKKMIFSRYWKCNSTIRFIVYFLTFTTYFHNKLTLACPSDVCTCKWKGGKQTVECGGHMLSNIPEGMDPGTQVLNFTGNSLQVLQSERFLRMDLLNLQKIYLSRNQLIRIHEKSFRGLSNLVELDLSDNSLQHVPSDTFQDYTSLMRLSLSGNPIRELKTSAFRHLAFLTTLELSNCQVEKIENEAFIGMDNLEWLRLDGNRISYIQGNHILPKSLHGISLHSNRWNCDCRLIDMHAWLVNYNTPQTEEPKCVEPLRLKGQTIKALKKDELACMPEVTPKTTFTEISEGRNISIRCTVRAIPEPKVLWLFNGQVLTNESLLDNLHMFHYIDESGVEEKHSEVYIYNIGPEDNGTFSCVGQNIAGTTFSNYTLRVIIKEPPVVNEVSFPKDYMNYIIASSGGFAIIFIVLLCTIVVKCRQRKKPKNKNTKNEQTTNDSGLMKCPSIINEEEMSPKSSSKENGVIIGNQMKQNFIMYAPTMQQGHHIIDSGNMQLNSTSAASPSLEAGESHQQHNHLHHSTIGVGGIGGSISYCSPPSSVRNYQQEKNPDLINDAESGKNNAKTDSEYDGSSDCSAPCSIQGNFENCYQLSNQFGSQILRPNQRFAAMSTLPRGLHLKSAGGNQHQVDVHLNPVCFLSQDGYTYDFSNSHLHANSQQQQLLQQQQQQQQHQQQQQQLQQSHAPSNAIQSAQQQNFYRTLPHNRAHKQQHFASSAANPGTRYSLEAEFLQRTGTPPYDKFLPAVRFTAEGYPIHPIVQYPSPPEGYKGDYSLPNSINSTSGQSAALCPSFQQWPQCLPGYHAQPIRYPATIVSGLTAATGAITIQQQSPPLPPALSVGIQQQQSSIKPAPTANNSNSLQSPQINASAASNGQLSSTTNPICGGSQQQTPQQPVTSNHTQTTSTSTSSLTTDVKKRCVGAQTTEVDTPTTIPECDEEQENSKLRHLTGPLADSPDEGYVGDSQEGSDI